MTIYLLECVRPSPQQGLASVFYRFFSTALKNLTQPRLEPDNKTVGYNIRLFADLYVDHCKNVFISSLPFAEVTRKSIFLLETYKENRNL